MLMSSMDAVLRWDCPLGGELIVSSLLGEGMPEVYLPWFLILGGSLWEEAAGSCDVLRCEGIIMEDNSSSNFYKVVVIPVVFLQRE